MAVSQQKEAQGLDYEGNDFIVGGTSMGNPFFVQTGTQ